MASRSLGELLLRPAPRSRISLALSQTPCVTSPSWSTRRTLTNSANPQSAQPQLQRKEEQEQAEEPSRQPQPQPQPQQQQQQTDNQQVSYAIDDLFAGMNNPAAFRRTTPSFPGRTPDSSDEMRAARASHVFGTNFSSPGSRNRTPLDINRMTMPDDGLPPDMPVNKPAVPTIPEEEKVYPRLNPSYGRSVELAPERGRDLVRGINMLGSLMARNKVRADFMKQRFHERPGLKRKRLKSERWRARFKQGFQQVTARVSELTRKGW